MSLPSSEGLEELFAEATRAQEEHLSFGLKMRETVGPRTVVTGEELDRQGLLAENQALVDAGYAAVRALYNAGVGPETIARHLGWVDAGGTPEVWGIHQITHTSWCDFCATSEADAARLSGGSHNICDRCLALATEVLVGTSASASNDLVVFRRCDEVQACLFCRRQPAGSSTKGTYASIGRDRWWKVPIETMVKATTVTGESAVACDACIEFYEQHFRTPPDQIRKVFLFPVQGGARE